MKSSSSFVNVARLQAEKDEATARAEQVAREQERADEERANQEEAERMAEAVQAESSVKNTKEDKKEPVSPKSIPLTEQEVAELVEVSKTHNYVRGYKFMGRTYYFRLWSVKDEEAWRMGRAKVAAKAYREISKELGLAFGETIPQQSNQDIEWLLSLYDNRHMVTKCLVKVDDGPISPEQAENLASVMSGDELSGLASCLGKHRDRFVDLITRSSVETEIKK